MPERTFISPISCMQNNSISSAKFCPKCHEFICKERHKKKTNSDWKSKSKATEKTGMYLIIPAASFCNAILIPGHLHYIGLPPHYLCLWIHHVVSLGEENPLHLYNFSSAPFLHYTAIFATLKNKKNLYDGLQKVIQKFHTCLHFSMSSKPLSLHQMNCLSGLDTRYKNRGQLYIMHFGEITGGCSYTRAELNPL